MKDDHAIADTLMDDDVSIVGKSVDSDEMLLHRISNADRDALETFYHRYYRRLNRFLAGLTRRVDVIDEVINDVMFVVWTKADTFGHRSRVSTWILGIAYRKAIKQLRKSGNNPEETQQDHEEHLVTDGPEGALAREQVLLNLQKALELLSVEHRAVIELTYVYGHSCKEIAEITNVPVNTVKTRMFHARKRLKKILPEMGMCIDAEQNSGEVI